MFVHETLRQLDTNTEQTTRHIFQHATIDFEPRIGYFDVYEQQLRTRMAFDAQIQPMKK